MKIVMNKHVRGDDCNNNIMDKEPMVQRIYLNRRCANPKNAICIHHHHQHLHRMIICMHMNIII